MQVCHNCRKLYELKKEVCPKCKGEVVPAKMSRRMTILLLVSRVITFISLITVMFFTLYSCVSKNSDYGELTLLHTIFYILALVFPQVAQLLYNRIQKDNGLLRKY